MRTAAILFIFLCSLSTMQAQNPTGKEYHLIVGTYSNADKTNGIHVYHFDTHTAAFSEKSVVTDIVNPSYLTVSADKKNVYAVSETGENKGSVNAYSFNPVTGELVFMNSVPSEGDHTCYVSVDKQKKFVFIGNYSGGNLLSVPLHTDGSLRSDVQNIQHTGSSVNKDRQKEPHVHSVVLSPDDRFLMVADLGTDKVTTYQVDTSKPQALSPAEPPFTSVKPGGGPRHLTFHPDGIHAYLVLEMEAAVVAFDYKDGKLVEKQTITMLSPDFKGKVGAADIHVSPDGKFLYASNRGEANEIVIYAIDKKGMLTYVGRSAVLGKTPRNFAIDPTGNYLLVGNQESNEIVIFQRNAKTGLLTATGKKISVDKPVCLKFVQAGL